MRVPRTNNVYGELTTPNGLQPVLDAIERLLGPGCASLIRSRASDLETLRLRTDAADFESFSMPGGWQHVFNGAVAGTQDEVNAFARALSGALKDAGVEHVFDVHDGRRVVLSLPEAEEAP